MGRLARMVRSIYLAGAIERAPDGGVAWRQRIHRFISDKLDLPVFNPCVEEVAALDPDEKRHFREWKETNFQRFQKAVRKILARDLAHLMQRTALVICYYDLYAMQGAGTAGELTLAYWAQIPVYLVVGIPLPEVPSWLLGCATQVFDDFDSLETTLLHQRDALRLLCNASGNLSAGHRSPLSSASAPQ